MANIAAMYGPIVPVPMQQIVLTSFIDYSPYRKAFAYQFDGRAVYPARRREIVRVGR
jgi:hypothetical protein